MPAVLKVAYNFLRKPIFRIRGYKLLNWQETFDFLKPYSVQSFLRHALLLPQIMNAGNAEAVIFSEEEIFSEAVYVWEYKSNKSKGKLSKYGSVIIDGNVLCTDESNQSFFKDVWKPDNRIQKQVPAFIALFSHHQDGMLYGGYYDFIFFVAAKICRIQDTFLNEDFSKWIFSYPIFKTDYERDYLTLLGVDINNVMDSREYQVISSNIIVGNGPSWYPNIEDILSLKRHIFNKINLIKNTGERIYISRNYRRKIINEDELIALLKKLDFTIIEDKPRSIAEQVSIYHNASFIIGPHGASFSNVIWCRQGTYLMELFSPNYTPDFFLYLSTVTGVHYMAYYEGEKDPSVDNKAGLVEDVYVSIPKLESYLKQVLV